MKKLLKQAGMWFVMLFVFLLTPSLNANGVDNAKKAQAAPLADGVKSVTDKDAVAEKKWNLRAMKEVEAAKTIDEILLARAHCNEGSEAWNRSVEKWDLQTLKDVAEATDLASAFLAWQHSRNGSRAEQLAVEKLDALCLKAAQEAKTLDEVTAMQARKGSPAYRLLMEKRNTLAMEAMREATTPEEAFAALQKSTQDDDAKALWNERWDALTLKEVQSKTTLKELWDEFVRTRPGSEARKLLIRKAEKFLPSK